MYKVNSGDRRRVFLLETSSGSAVTEESVVGSFPANTQFNPISRSQRVKHGCRLTSLVGTSGYSKY